MSGPAGLRRTGPAQPALRWMLWTRRRAVGIGVGLVGGSILVAHLLAGTGAPPHTTPPATPAAPSAAPASPADPAAPVGPQVLAGGPPPGQTPEQVAAGFAARWVAHRGVSADAWVAGVAPWCTPQYGAQTLPAVNPDTVPATQVTGPAHLVHSDDRSAEVDVPLDGLTVRASLLDVASDDGDNPPTPARALWRVNDLNPAPAP